MAKFLLKCYYIAWILLISESSLNIDGKGNQALLITSNGNSLAKSNCSEEVYQNCTVVKEKQNMSHDNNNDGDDGKRVPLYIALMLSLSGRTHYVRYARSLPHVVRAAFREMAQRSDILPGYKLNLLLYDTQVSLFIFLN